MNMIVDPEKIIAPSKIFVDRTAEYEAYIRIYGEEKKKTAIVAQAIAAGRVIGKRARVWEQGYGRADVTIELAQALHAALKGLELVIIGKEVKSEFILPALEKFADAKLPRTVVAATNLEVPQLKFDRQFFHETLAFNDALPFAHQTKKIEELLTDHWGNPSQKSANKDPAVAILYAAALADSHPHLIPAPGLVSDAAERFGFDYMQISHGFRLGAKLKFKRDTIFALAENLAPHGALFVTHSEGRGDSVETAIRQCLLTKDDRFDTNKPEILFGDLPAELAGRYKVTVLEPIICRPTKQLDPENAQDLADAVLAFKYVAQLTDPEREIAHAREVAVAREILYATDGFPTVRNAAVTLEPR